MTIGINITALQTGHRMRGIGSVVINFINNISRADREKHSFVFYMKENTDAQEALGLLDLAGLNYAVEYLQTPQPVIKLRLRGRLNMPIALLNKCFGLLRLRIGMPLPGASRIDCYLHTDQSESMPRGRQFRKVMIAYDIIPYVMEWDYLHSYRTALLRGKSKSQAIRAAINRWSYIKRLRINVRRADHILAISSHTAADYMKYLGVPKSKVSVQPLGVSPPEQYKATKPDYKYLSTSWGYFKHKAEFDDEPFLLYVGGADPRRRLDDLVAAFNNLRAEGKDIKLVLTGDTMQGPYNIPTLPIQHALNGSSYLDDIIFLGFANEDTKNWLYENALAFIYPSLYEGFGLPVLEAMVQGCPVICYENAAVHEIAGELPLYAADHEDIRKYVLQLLKMPKTEREKIKSANINHVRRYSWIRTSKAIIEQLQKT